MLRNPNRATESPTTLRFLNEVLSLNAQESVSNMMSLQDCGIPQ